MENNTIVIEDSIVNLESFKEKAPYKLDAIFKKWKKERLLYSKGNGDIHLPKHIGYLSAIGQRTMKIYIDYLLPFTPVDYSLRFDEIKRGISKTKKELHLWQKQKMISEENPDGHYDFLLENFYQVFEDVGIDLTKTPMHEDLQSLYLKIEDVEESRDKEEDSLMNHIHRIFGFMERVDPRKHRDILSEDEYERLVDWVHHYFSNGFEVPQITEPILKVHTSKGNIIWAFRSLFSELHPSHTVPQSLFELYTGAFYQFREDRFDNFKKQKKPQYFDSL
ncbi:hypothetical protein J0X14_17240 [Muricauda sp. CAU 1633]|uniref:hypothetical protein n=1 Tax=Allomuricauda sp. CAU 1633 TaxID=2816036 RepID=UPI001A90164E|nr:hypothetical protein [Muricauda sp. CAU 1633]MBO0324057.1 hypothetical protein [Muricauda sp. CAU 1633]